MSRDRYHRYHTVSMLPWKTYRLRVCRTLHHCEVCGKDITLGEQYRDGGYSRRAHEDCVDQAKAADAVARTTD